MTEASNNFLLFLSLAVPTDLHAGELTPKDLAGIKDFLLRKASWLPYMTLLSTYVS